MARAAPPLGKRPRRPASTSAHDDKHDTISASAASACSPVACALAMPPVPTIPNRSVPAIVVAGRGREGSSGPLTIASVGVDFPVRLRGFT